MPTKTRKKRRSMPRLRRNEWNFASNAARIITEILARPEYAASPLGHAEAELTELRGARRLDLVIFDRATGVQPLITGELKVPWDAQGRTPYNTSVVEAAHTKASQCGALYFLTWNIRRCVARKTNDPGVELDRRVVVDVEVVPQALASRESLDRPDVQASLIAGIEALVAQLHGLLVGPAAPAYLPLDQLFVARLEASLDFPIERTVAQLTSIFANDLAEKARIEAWMRERQGWITSAHTERENIDRAARFTCYVLVNRLCFYSALRRRYDQLPRLTVANNITTGSQLRDRLKRAFDEARRFTGDYDTVFEGDRGDAIPFLTDEAVAEWRALIRSLDRYDFAHIDSDVIGSMYERLIQPEERHRYGQHYTQPVVVDLINACAIRQGDATILDPACGGGTFLVGAYSRKRTLDPTQDHAQLLEHLYGCDTLHYACHLSIINLAVRALIDDDNFPRIHCGDFLDLQPGSIFSHQPIRIQAGGLPTGEQLVPIEEAMFNAVVGNPPYIESKGLPAPSRQKYLDLVQLEWPQYSWAADSDISVWFWTHSARFLRANGYLGLLTQAAWLDVQYGFPLQDWMLNNFKILLVMESEVEPWFTDARVATTVTILQQESDELARNTNLTRFVQFRRPLSQLLGAVTTEDERRRANEQLRDTLLSIAADSTTTDFRVRVVSQDMLQQRGVVDQQYKGSKWGRYLRAIESLYQLQNAQPEKFVSLGELADVNRGSTTNCDEFFIVADISEEALASVPNAAAFRDSYGVPRATVASGQVKIVKRSDGVALALDNVYLRPALKTARGAFVFATSRIHSSHFFVYIDEDRDQLTRRARAYVEAGEREGWHNKPSFQQAHESGRNWYTLREATAAPILFVKTMQYAPLVYWNDQQFLANQRLYKVMPKAGVDPKALCAALNSTIFASERFSSTKALGREAAGDLEVFSTRALKVPDIRQMSPALLQRLSNAMDVLAARDAGMMVEQELMEAGLAEARVYTELHPIGEDTWPMELKDLARHEVDSVMLDFLGVDATDITHSRTQQYNELLEHTRKLRMLELEAQVNRRGQTTGRSRSTAQYADEIWARILAAGQCEIRHIPDDFIDEAVPCDVVFLPPARRIHAEGPGLFEDSQFAARFGRQLVEFTSEEQMDYCILLASNGVSGDTKVPTDRAVCRAVGNSIQEYLGTVLPLVENAVAEITEDGELQSKIQRDAIRRLVASRH